MSFTAPPRFRRLALAVVVLIVIILALMRSQSSATGRSLGVREGRLAPCPDSPNCVCSQDADAAHAIAPQTFRGSAAEAMRGLKQVLAAQPRVRVLAETPDYLHAEFRTALFRFVDDVEFLVVEKDHLIHVRSASRIGHSDLGTNGRRIEALRREFNQASEN